MPFFAIAHVFTDVFEKKVDRAVDKAVDELKIPRVEAEIGGKAISAIVTGVIDFAAFSLTAFIAVKVGLFIHVL